MERSRQTVPATSCGRGQSVMDADAILAEYDRLLSELNATVHQAEWERIVTHLDDIEALQEQFAALPAAERKRSDVQNKLRDFLSRQEKVMQAVAHAKESVTQHIRKLKAAQTQQHGYQQAEQAEAPPLFYSRKV